MPSECEWFWRYAYEVALPALLGKEVISRIKQINTDGEKKLHEPLTKLSLDETSICAYHMIDKLFKTKVSVT
jgi:hypothetical protein